LNDNLYFTTGTNLNKRINAYIKIYNPAKSQNEKKAVNCVIIGSVPGMA